VTTSFDHWNGFSIATIERLQIHSPIHPEDIEPSAAMRSDTLVDAPSPHCKRQESPKSSNIWSTERRLMERPPPDAPRKSRRRHASSYRSDTIDYEASTKKQRNNRLLLPSLTFDEDIDGPSFVSLQFRPTNLMALFDNTARLMHESTPLQDPTTVLMAPISSSLWYEEEDNETDDMVLSPRLFQFGRHNLTSFEAVDLAEVGINASHEIFRESDSDEEENTEEEEEEDRELESREIANDDHINRLAAWTSRGNSYESSHSDDDDRL
jgi:hypothetical protein